MNQWAHTLPDKQGAEAPPPPVVLCLSHDPSAKLPFLRVSGTH